METPLTENRNISHDKAIKLLQKQGVKLSPENAKEVLHFLYLLAELYYNVSARLTPS